MTLALLTPREVKVLAEQNMVLSDSLIAAVNSLIIKNWAVDKARFNADDILRCKGIFKLPENFQEMIKIAYTKQGWDVAFKVTNYKNEEGVDFMFKEAPENWAG